MKKLLLVITLSGLACASGAEKLNLSLSQPPSHAADKADFSLKWRPEAAPENARGPGPWEEKKAAPEQPRRYPAPSMFGRVHRSDRLRVTDPEFSAFNSDEGYKPH